MNQVNKYNILEELYKGLNKVADETGIVRCGMLFQMGKMVGTLEEMLKKEEEAYSKKIKELEDKNSELQKAVDLLSGVDEELKGADIEKGGDKK